MSLLIDPFKFAAPAPTTYLAEALADSPLAIWMLDEPSGTLQDSSGSARHLSKQGAPTQGAATVMPNGSGSIDISNTSNYPWIAAASWMAASSFTVTAWINMDVTTSYKCIASRESNSGSNRQWSFYVTGGKLNMFTSADRLGTATLSTGTNYFVAATYDSAASTLKYYINGALDTTLTSVTIPNSATTTPHDIFISNSRAASGSQNFPFDGRMQGIGYYGSALSGARLTAQYNAGL